MAEHSENQDSRYRVAFDLMQTIANSESDRQKKPDPRTYYLTLYYQCVKATWARQIALDGVLSED
jgi:hypothetical protein